MIRVPRSEWGNQAQWAVTAPLLAASLGGVDSAVGAALGLCAITTVFYALKLRSARPYRVQVRLGFLAVVGSSLLPGMESVLWIPLVGTTAQVLFGYCPMARFLDAMPWNRDSRLTWRGFGEIITRRPGDEGLFVSAQ